MLNEEQLNLSKNWKPATTVQLATAIIYNFISFVS